MLDADQGSAVEGLTRARLPFEARLFAPEEMQLRTVKRLTMSVVVPVFNEEGGIFLLLNRLTAALSALDVDWEVLFVNDGSSDNTLRVIRELHAVDERVRAISFSRNFGKETAVAAGLRHVTSDVAVVIDADLQHPPEIIGRLLEKWHEGHQIVFARRADRATDSVARRLFSTGFYALFNAVGQTALPAGINDFALFDRKAVVAINAICERNRFNKGLYAWIGFHSTSIPFEVGQRAEGRSKFNLAKLTRFAVDGIICFSSFPLKVWSFVGIFISFAAIFYSIYFTLKTVLLGSDVPGFPSLLVSIAFLSGIQLISLGFLGEYVARVYDEVKGRPLFIVDETIGLSTPQRSTSAG